MLACSPFKFIGSRKHFLEVIFSGSGIIPFGVNIYPKNYMCSSQNIDFAKLNVMLCLKALLKSNFKCFKCSSNVSDSACTSSTNVNKKCCKSAVTPPNARINAAELVFIPKADTLYSNTRFKIINAVYCFRLAVREVELSARLSMWEVIVPFTVSKYKTFLYFVYFRVYFDDAS